MSEFLLRPMVPEAVEAAAAVVRRAEVHDGAPHRTSTEELAETFASHGFSVALDACLVGVGDAPVAFGYVTFHPTGAGQERAYCRGAVDPDWRGRGIGRALLGWQLARSEALLADVAGGVPRFIRVEQLDGVTDAHRLYEHFGLAVVRHFDEMERTLDLPIPAVRAPAGVAIVDWPVDRFDELRLAKNRSFADHWGSAPMSAQEWAGWMHASTVRLDLSVAALDDATGEILGHCLCSAYPADEEVSGRREAWVDNIGTIPTARGRGIAAAMLTECLRRFAAAGFAAALLGVDADSPTNAPAVYRRLGFRETVRTVHRQIALDGP